MPILEAETDLYPNDLFERPDIGAEEDSRWWALYTLSRREKDLMRRLEKLEVPFYCPIIPQRHRSPAGRLRTSYMPLFSNYVFVYGTVDQRYEAYTTGCVSRDIKVRDGIQLTDDLRQIHKLIEAGVPLHRESKLLAGEKVRVRTGPFRNFEGFIVRREGKSRLLVAVGFLQRGASVVLEECEVEPL